MLLEVKNLSKNFGGLLAVNNLSFDVERGEFVGLIGPNGSGKSTTFSMIAGFLRPTSGRILFQGLDIMKWGAPHRICRLGIVRTFQHMRPFMNATVEQNVIVGALSKNANLDKSQDLAERVIKDLGLLEKRYSDVGQLSVRERKLVELGRALASQPSLLLIDEIMAGLAPQEQEQIMTILRRLNQEGLAIMMVEHIMRVVSKLVNRLLVLDFGQKIADGPPASVITDRRVREAYLGGG